MLVDWRTSLLKVSLGFNTGLYEEARGRKRLKPVQLQPKTTLF